MVPRTSSFIVPLLGEDTGFSGALRFGAAALFESPGLRQSKNVAEREGFEPSRRGLATYAISSRVPSASSDTSPHTLVLLSDIGNNRKPAAAPVRISGSPAIEKRGGEGGIRTLGTVLPVQPLSRRLPSADSATSPNPWGTFPVPFELSNILAEGVGFDRWGLGGFAIALPASSPTAALLKSRSSSFSSASAPVRILSSSGVEHPGGGSRIRTHGSSRFNGFQDRCLKPLGHPSVILLL
jgi:hypothetical protein